MYEIVIGVLVLSLVFCLVRLYKQVRSVKKEEIQHELDTTREFREVYENMTKLVHEIDRLHDIIEGIDVELEGEKRWRWFNHKDGVSYISNYVTDEYAEQQNYLSDGWVKQLDDYIGV